MSSYEIETLNALIKELESYPARHLSIKVVVVETTTQKRYTIRAVRGDFFRKEIDIIVRPEGVITAEDVPF